MVVLQAFINISVVLGMMPTKGIPLPLVSYGGSSLFVTLACVGGLLNITKQAEGGLQSADCRFLIVDAVPPALAIPQAGARPSTIDQQESTIPSDGALHSLYSSHF